MLIQRFSSLLHSQCTTEPQCFLACESQVTGPDNPRSGYLWGLVRDDLASITAWCWLNLWLKEYNCNTVVYIFFFFLKDL